MEIIKGVMTQPCIELETIGKFKEFMENSKGTRVAIVGIVFAIIVQVVTFAFMWGTLNNTVSSDNKYLWEDITPSVKENTRNLDRLVSKLDGVRLIAVKGDQGDQGEQGDRGQRGNTGCSNVPTINPPISKR